DAERIAERLYNSATNANGQMCTCPGLIFAARGDGTETFLRALAKHMNEAQPQMMLSRRTRDTFARRVAEVVAVPGVDVRAGSPPPPPRGAAPGAAFPAPPPPALFKPPFDSSRRPPPLHEEVFGPATILVLCDQPDQLADAAASIQGSLTGTIWAAGYDE